MSQPLLIYCPHITPRLNYIVSFINHELFDRPAELTGDRSRFDAYQGARLNYSDQDTDPNAFYIRPVPLLFETGISHQTIYCFELNFHKAFYATEGDFPFDIFAASFYLLSRYEEYYPGSPDLYGRYAHTESLAYREGFLDLPLVNIWLQEFKRALLAKFPDLIFRYISFRFIPTYDIDIAWSYLHKGWRRNVGGLLRSAGSRSWSEVKQRIQVLRGLRADPFDSYEWLDSIHLYCRLKPIYFFLVAEQRRGVDKNISPARPAMQDLIKYHAAGYQTGIHPSWQSGEREAVLKEEVEWMEAITEQSVVRSRQHYLRFTLPEGYRRLIRQGIREDYSMGYGTINGFRASVASSFNWYDLEKEEETGLQIFPFCFMDANAFYEQRLTAAQAMNELLHYFHLIKRVNGLMITLWHNDFLGTDLKFAGWREVYEIFLKEEVYWEA